MDKIKLVIWDLDETFWNGTLSEGGIQPIETNIAIVKELCNRGILNSIVSKNNFDDAKQKLIELGVWEYFVFPIMEWKAKGPLIKEIIKRCQLRAENTLFIDDNHLNIEEAIYFNPQLHVMSNKSIDTILTHKAFIGKDDRNHSRLKQYKILEKKYEYSKNYSDNVSFLRDSNIKIFKIEGEKLHHHIDRIVELIERTNQLNYTKLRSSKKEIELLLNNNKYKSCALKVSDKFGDYGIVGFYSLDTTNNSLKHFTFSCRILNLGVEQFVYSQLNFPKLNVVPEVATTLDKSCPDWISVDSSIVKISVKNLMHNERTNNLLFFKGGCDLGQMLFYMRNRGFSFIEETNYVSRNNFPIHQEHTQIVLDSYYLSDENKNYVINSDFIPFVDKKFYDSKLFSGKYKAVIYSVLMDFTQELYQHKNRDIILPFGGYYSHWTDKNNDSDLFITYENNSIQIPKDTFIRFRKEFEYIGQITPDIFKENLRKIRSLVPIETPIIFMNGAELESPDSNEVNAQKRHIIMNRALDDFIRESENTYLLDVRETIKNKDQLTNNLRHYDRKSYQMLATNLLKLLNTVLDIEIKEKIDPIVLVKEKIIRNKYLLNLYRRIKKQITNKHRTTT